jgi:hypothetical protein
MQMGALMTSHIVGLAWVHEEIGLRAFLDTGGNERQTVLWHNRGIIVTGDNL